MHQRAAVASVRPVGRRAPCIIGVAQRTWHLSDHEQAPEPLAMWADVVRAAANDAQAGRGDVLAAVEQLAVVYCMSWPYDDPVGRLAERLQIAPAARTYSGIGGTVPQQLVSTAAAAIAGGDLDVAVVCGAEALDTVRRLKKAGERPAWSHRHPDQQPFPFEAPFHPAEVAHEVFQAWLTFAVRDIARRAHRRTEPGPHREQLGQVLAPMTEVAAANPHSWFPVERSAHELITPTPDNRLVGYPYTKQMVAVMDVDMGAAVILASQDAADRLGVPADRRVYLRSSRYGTDPVYLAEHEDLWRSPAMSTVFAEALAGAGVAVEEVAHLDLYSCFASSVCFACDALGIDPLTDPRSLTVTGGLPYAGGPASNYPSHAVASMVEVLRADPGSLGLVSGVGMHMTKHVAGLYSTDPSRGRPSVMAATSTTEPVTVPITDRWDGSGTVAAYSVVHGRDGEPQWAVAVVDLPEEGGRAYARADGDPGLLGDMEAHEWVGRPVTLRADGEGVNRLSA